MLSRLSSEKGFTLLEMIISLVLVGIIAASAGMGLVAIAQGYMLTKENAETIQKAQITMARLAKELGTATIISSADTASITFTRPASAGSMTSITNTITISGGLIQISGGTPGILTNNVNTASFTFFDGAGTTPLSAPVTAVADIRRIDIGLTLRGADNSASVFNSSVFTQESFY